MSLTSYLISYPNPNLEDMPLLMWFKKLTSISKGIRTLFSPYYQLKNTLDFNLVSSINSFPILGIL